jgi:hypothetical protein
LSAYPLSFVYIAWTAPSSYNVVCYVLQVSVQLREGGMVLQKLSSQSDLLIDFQVGKQKNKTLKYEFDAVQVNVGLRGLGKGLT